MELPNGQKSFKTDLAVLDNTDLWQTDGQTPHDGKDRVMHSVAGVKINEKSTRHEIVATAAYYELIPTSGILFNRHIYYIHQGQVTT